MVKLYQKFLQYFVDKKYLQNYPNVTVLAENLVDGYYIVIFESIDKSAVENGEIWKGITM